jgi:hypothetical protein
MRTLSAKLKDEPPRRLPTEADRIQDNDGINQDESR